MCPISTDLYGYASRWKGGGPQLYNNIKIIINMIIIIIIIIIIITVITMIIELRYLPQILVQLRGNLQKAYKPRGVRGSAWQAMNVNSLSDMAPHLLHSVRAREYWMYH